ncbi:VOC family protein [Dictyobacter vulcani]|nr:VOC family protein [Dictyobacter vulcani]
MTNTNIAMRHGMGTVRPYLYGKLDLLDFVKNVFGAEELERASTGENGVHVEVQIGDSVVVLEIGKDFTAATRASTYVYVSDVDAAYQRAIQAGATSLSKPEDKPYHERGAGVRDTFGNIWWIATYAGKN